MGRVFGGLVALFATMLVQPATAAELRLLMFEQPGCIYCAKWDIEIAPKYELTDEGKAAPLTRMHLRDKVPDDLSLQRPAAFTPTFVLVRDGAETGRIEGYPGEDFFWPLLDRLIREANDSSVEDAGE